MFWKVIDGQLVGRKAVITYDYELYAYMSKIYQFPVHGWLWAEYENEARSYFGLPLRDITEDKK
jgi:hypothetical protein